jgi:hypothetical protein
MIWKNDLRHGPSTPMTYLHQGRQYIAMATGGGAQSEVIALASPARTSQQPLAKYGYDYNPNRR